MGEYLVYTVVVAMLAAFTILLLRKWGVIECMQVHGNDFIAKLASCDFCLSWWAGVLLSILLSLFTGNAVYLLIPLCSTPITRFML